jgi:hypothetical protein
MWIVIIYELLITKGNSIKYLLPSFFSVFIGTFGMQKALVPSLNIRRNINPPRRNITKNGVHGISTYGSLSNRQLIFVSSSR